MLALIGTIAFFLLIGQTSAVLAGCHQPKTLELSTILPAAKVDYSSLTISGFSSGAMMAVQYHFAHSSEVRGAGIFAGCPYGAFKLNSHNDAKILFIPVSTLITAIILPPIEDSNPKLEEQAEKFADQGLIDPLSNLEGSQVFIFHGAVDPVVNNEYGWRTADMYDNYGANVVSNLDMLATHTVPTDNFPTGLPDCEVLNPLADEVNNCDYQGITDMFHHLYEGDHIKPFSSTTAVDGKLYRFNQKPYTATGGLEEIDFMNPTGYVYIPNYCNKPENTCKLHIALHGCTQSIYSNTLCNVFATNTGYMQEADANHVVIVFPTASAIKANLRNITTNFSCWDIFGATQTDYYSKNAPQIISIRNIARAVAGLPF